MAREKISDVDRSVKAVKRTLSILDAFIQQPGGITLGELEASTGLFKSVILRYMLTLEAERYVFRHPDGYYLPGARACQLGISYEKSYNLNQHILPVLDKLTHATLESSTFYILDGESRMCLLRKDSPHHIKSSVPVGTILPLDDTSSGTVLRTFRDGKPDEWNDEKGIFTSTGTGLNQQQPTSLMTASVSAPVFKRNGELAGALSVSGPVTRFNPEDISIRQLVLSAARELSYVLGG